MVAVFHPNENNALIRKREFVDFVDHISDAISGYRDCFAFSLCVVCFAYVFIICGLFGGVKWF